MRRRDARTSGTLDAADRSSQVKQLLMEGVGRQPRFDHVLVERLTELRRPAEPDVAVAPTRLRLAYALRRQAPALAADPHVQAHVRRMRQRPELTHLDLLARRGGVEEGDLLSVGAPRQMLHPRDERRHADADADPDLAFVG